MLHRRSPACVYHATGERRDSLVEKDKAAPVPERKQADIRPPAKDAEPKFVRGTIDPPTKKKG